MKSIALYGYIALVTTLVLVVSVARASVTADVTLRWSAPEDGAPVESYSLSCTGPEDDTIIDAELPGDAESYSTTVQLSDGDYECSLVAHNAQGRAGEPATAEFRISPAPGAPTDFRATLSITFGG